MICRSLKKVISDKPNIKVRIVVDNANIRNIRNNTRHIPRNLWNKELGLSVDTSSDVEIKSVHIPMFGTMHSKFMVVDGSFVVLSSNNVQDRPNMELAVSLKGEVCQGFKNIFFRLWKEGTTSNGQTPPSISSGCSSMVFVNRKAYGGLNNDVDSVQNHAWWTLMSVATKNITICTPTFNAYHAIEGVYNACKRNVCTTLILTKNFNDKKEALPFQGGTNDHVVKLLRRRLKCKRKENNLHVRWHVGRNEKQTRKGVHSHVKFLIVDDAIIMFGNGNMDTQSWYHSMEVNLLLESPELCLALLDTVTKNSVVALSK